MLNELIAGYAELVAWDEKMKADPSHPKAEARETRFKARCAAVGLLFDAYCEAVPAADPASVLYVMRTASGEQVPEPTP